MEDDDERGRRDEWDRVGVTDEASEGVNRGLMSNEAMGSEDVGTAGSTEATLRPEVSRVLELGDDEVIIATEEEEARVVAVVVTPPARPVDTRGDDAVFSLSPPLSYTKQSSQSCTPRFVILRVCSPKGSGPESKNICRKDSWSTC